MASAHIQGVGASAQGSGWATLPEPGFAGPALVASLELFRRRLRDHRRGHARPKVAAENNPCTGSA